jgi:hypothetical protein
VADLVETWKRVARARMACESGGGRARIAVHVTLGFMLLCALAGLGLGRTGPLFTLALLSSVVLAHELPRALVARLLGRSSKVTLSAIAGETDVHGPPLRGGAAAAFELAGPLGNFMVALAAFALRQHAVASPHAPLLMALALSHAAWGAVQVLPVLPFRFGRAVSRLLTPSQRVLHAAASAVSVFALGGAVEWARVPVLFPMLTLAAFASASSLGRLLPEWWDARLGARALAEEAEAKLRAGDANAGVALAERGLISARATRLRKRLWTTLAWSAIGTRDPLLAHHAMCHLSEDELDFYLVAAYLSCCNRVAEAEQLLIEARRLGHRDRDTTKLLIDLHFRSGDSNAVLELARADGRLLAPDDWQAIEAAIPNAKRT